MSLNVVFLPKFSTSKSCYFVSICHGNFLPVSGKKSTPFVNNSL